VKCAKIALSDDEGVLWAPEGVPHAVLGDFCHVQGRSLSRLRQSTPRSVWVSVSDGGAASALSE